MIDGETSSGIFVNEQASVWSDKNRDNELSSRSDAGVCLETCLLRDKTRRVPTVVLLTGPSGSGKSRLASHSARRAGFRVIHLSAQDLAADEAGAVEAAITNAFRELFTAREDVEWRSCYGSSTTHVAILFDDLDLWAPAKLRSPAELRIVAALCEELAGMQEEPLSASAFIATACDKGAVYPGLLNSRCISKIISLHALSIDERIELSRTWLGELLEKNDDAVVEVAEKVAAATPGFLHADMERLFSLLDKTEWISSTDLSSLPASAVLSGSVFWEALKLVTPSLLATTKGALVSQVKRADFSRTTLYGLEEQVKQLEECLTSIFSPRVTAAGSGVSETIAALQNVGAFKGLILHGPTGCGKSAIAAMADSAVSQRTVNILQIETTAIISSVVGEAERNLSRLFTIARAIAPAVVVMENIDMFAPNRFNSKFHQQAGGSASEAFNRILSTLLTELDGIMDHSGSNKVFFIATTRSLDLVDNALLRPGRFEMHISVHAPDAKARIQILNSFLSTAPLDLTHDLKNYELLDFKKYAALSEGWTAPDIYAFGRELMLRVASKRVMAHQQTQDLCDLLATASIT